MGIPDDVILCSRQTRRMAESTLQLPVKTRISSRSIDWKYKRLALRFSEDWAITEDCCDSLTEVGRQLNLVCFISHFSFLQVDGFACRPLLYINMHLNIAVKSVISFIIFTSVTMSLLRKTRYCT